MSPAAQPRGFSLGDYVEVKDRIRLFYEAHPTGRLATTEVRMTTEPDGKPRVVVEAGAWRTPDDPVPAKGWSWMELPGTTPYTKGSELENTETSAWGRAIAALGIGISRSIGSKNEIEAKNGTLPLSDGLIGTANVGKKGSDATWELKLTPTGHVLVFRLEEGRKGWKVISTSPIAEAMAEHREAIEGQRVECWGWFSDESFEKKQPDGTARTITFQVLHLTRIETPAGTFSEPDEDDDADDPGPQ